MILSTSYGAAIVNRGLLDGFHLSDKVIVVRRINAGDVMVGFLDIVRIYDKDFESEKSAEFLKTKNGDDKGIHPKDEVYIINRDDSPYSLSSGQIRIHHEIKPSAKSPIEDIIKLQKTKDIKVKIQNLQFQLTDAKDELKKQQVDLVRETVKHKVHVPTAMVTFISDGTGYIPLTFEGGFRLSDKVIVVRRSEEGCIIRGFLEIEENRGYEIVARMSTEFGSPGLYPEDEVYIINRDDSPYSLSAAQLWVDTKKKSTQ